MECDEVRELLSVYIDGALDVENKVLVEEHLQTCGACKEELTSLQSVIHELGSLEHVEAPDDFLDKVHERIEEHTGFVKILRTLFVPPRIKISLQFATVAATAVLVFGIYTLMQPEKQIGTGPSVSRGIRVAEKTKKGPVEPVPKRESYKTPPVLKEAAAPQRVRERKPIEVVLVIKADMERAAPVPSVVMQAPAREKKERAIERETTAAADAPEKEIARRAAPQAGLSANWLEEERRPSAVTSGERPPTKDKAVALSSSLNEAFSKVDSLIEQVGGKIISREYDAQSGRPRYITAEIPVKNFPLFFDGLNQVGVPQSPVPAMPAKDQRTVQIRIRFLSSN